MATQTRPVKNQIAFHEKINKIENASGNIYLNLEISTVHELIVENNVSIYIETPNPGLMLPSESFIQVFVITHFVNTTKTLTFDPDIKWTTATTPSFSLTDKMVCFSIFSSNAGLTWTGLVSGIFNE